MGRKTVTFDSLNLDLALDNLDTFDAKGIDTEEFYCPDLDANDFRIDGVDDDDAAIWDDSRYVRPRMELIRNSHIKYENAVHLVNDMPMLQKGERWDVLMGGRFIVGDFIEAFFVEHNLHTDRLLLSTLSLNENNVDSIKNLMEGGYVENVDIIVSAYFYAHEKWKLIKYMYQELDFDNRFQLAVANIHCKTYQWQTDEGLKIILSGSANLRSSANLENMVIEENADTFDFYQSQWDELIARYATIQKDKVNLKTWYDMEAIDKERKAVRLARRKSKEKRKEGAE